MDPKLLDLPTSMQFSLVCGYLAYHLGYIGMKSHHRPLDVAFLTLVFGLIATFVFSWSKETCGNFPAAVLGLIAALLSGFLWRKWIRAIVHWTIRKVDLSWSNDDPTALRTILSGTDNYVTQASVELKDGTILRCNDTGRFNGAPFAPMVIGESGDIALYVSHVRTKNGRRDREQPSTIDPAFGSRITYIPAAEVRRVHLRMKPKKEGQSSPAGGGLSCPVAGPGGD